MSGSTKSDESQVLPFELLKALTHHSSSSLAICFYVVQLFIEKVYQGKFTNLSSKLNDKFKKKLENFKKQQIREK